MKSSVESEHRQYFRKNHRIEFDGLLTPSQVEEINGGLAEALASRLHVKAPRAFFETAEQTFNAGRDLWRHNDVLKKYATSSRLAEIASELIEYKPLRLAYDQFYPSLHSNVPLQLSSTPYRDLIRQPRSLKEISCVQGILGGLILCLDGDTESTTTALFPAKAGSGVFFSAEAVLDFNELFQEKPHRYWMIVYTHPTSIYLLEEADPQTHELKRAGYVFGDKLSDKLNPIVYR